MSMFPGAGAVVYYNEAGEPLGWDYPSPDDEVAEYQSEWMEHNPPEDEEYDDEEDECLVDIWWRRRRYDS